MEASELSLWTRFRADAIPEPELRTIIGSHFQQAGQIEPNWIGYPDPDAPALILRYKGRQLSAIHAGPALVEADVEAIEQRVSDALSPAPTTIRRDFLFATVPTDGSWRYHDRFQIVPAPPDAPRPPALIAKHPLVLELEVPHPPDHGVRTFRETVARSHLRLVLGTLLTFSISEIGLRPKKHWVYVREDHEDVTGHTAWCQEMYFVPGFGAYVDEFSDTSRLPRIVERDDDSYYSRRGIGTDERLEVPASLEALLDVYFGMPPPEQERFVRACYWFCYSSDVWSISGSAAFISLVQAIEALLPAVSQRRCPECGKPSGPGPTQQFAEFVERHVPDVDGKARTRLYATRSALTHGQALMQMDLNEFVLGGMHPQEWDQLEQFGVAQRAARLGLVNWLRAREQPEDGRAA